MIHVIDAHAIIWHLDDPHLLGVAAEAVMADRTARVVAPSIVLAEIKHLHGRGRIRVSPTRVRALLQDRPKATIHPLDERVIDRLPIGLEIHDAIIVATALVLAAADPEPVRVVARDRQIIASGLVDVLW